VHRNLFNVGQHVLTLGAAWLVLRSFNIDPSPLHPWMFSEPHIRLSELVAVGLAGLAYLVVVIFVAAYLLIARGQAIALAPTLIPIAAVYFTAHYFAYLLIAGEDTAAVFKVIENQAP